MNLSAVSRKILAYIVISSSFLFANEQISVNSTNDWRFEAGVSAGNLTPIEISAGVGYKSIIFHIEGMGWHFGPNDFWCGLRGGLGWTFFKSLPFSIDVGISSGYNFAEAPNKMHQALNKANNAKYVYPYNYKETLDISAETRIHLYGLFTQINYPIYRFTEHRAPKLLWRAGYMISF